MTDTAKPRHAAGTTVGVDRSQAEIKKLLRDHGATGIAFGWRADPPAHVVAFEIDDRKIRFVLTLPTHESFRVQYRGAVAARERTPGEIRKVADQEEQRLWRSLAATIKARLIAIADHIETVEQAFHAYLVMANGQTLGEWSAPQIAAMYDSGAMPPILPGLPDAAPPQLTD